jgi:hypothetical protein
MFFRNNLKYRSRINTKKIYVATKCFTSISLFKKLRKIGGAFCSHKTCKNQGVKQGCPMSPTLFNIFIDEVIRHWQDVLIKDF